MGLKMKNIWKIFLSTALSASIAATNAFAVVTIEQGDVDTAQLISKYKEINDGNSATKVLSYPFVNGKRVCNNYNRGAGAFDCIPGETTPKAMGNIMTIVHSIIYSLVFSEADCTGTTKADRFSYPIGTSNEHKLIAALVQALHAKLSTPGAAAAAVQARTTYANLLQLIHLTLSHLWFLRCPDGYGAFQLNWDKATFRSNQFPFFHRIGLKFVNKDGSAKTGHKRSNNHISSEAFNGIKNNDTLKSNVIEALTIAEDGWKHGLFGWKNKAFDIDNSLEKSDYTQNVYNMLNDTLYALLVYGLSSLAPDKNPLTTYNRYATELNNPLLPDGIIHTTTKLLSQTISKVKKCRPISDDVKKIITMRNGPVKKQIPSTEISHQPLLEEQTREETMLNIDEEDAIEALLMLGQKTKFSENQGEPATKRQRTSSTAFLHTTIPPLPLPTPIATMYPLSPKQYYSAFALLFGNEHTSDN